MRKNAFAWPLVLSLLLLGCSQREEKAPSPQNQSPSAAPQAAEAEFVEGKNYFRLPAPISEEPKAGKIEITEFFFYGCPHCFRLQKPLNEWVASLGPRIERKLSPAVLSERWVPLARAFHAMEAAGFDPALHEAIFNEIHVQGMDLGSPEKLFAFIEQEKGSEYRAKFEKAYSSPETDAAIEKDRKLDLAAQLEGTPTVVINGRFSLNSASAGGEDKMVPLLIYLSQKAAFGQLR